MSNPRPGHGLTNTKPAVLAAIIANPGKKSSELRAIVAPVELISPQNMTRILLELFEEKLVKRRGIRHHGYTYFPVVEKV